MRGARKVLASLTLTGLALVLALVPQRASSNSGGRATQAENAEPVPAFHSEVPSGALPVTMSPSLFPQPVEQNAYAVAARIKKVLYQEPCYCHCDRSQGHASLLDCFVSRHAAGCNICMKEDFYAYEQFRKSKTAAQIREGIKRGEWDKVDMTKYQPALPAEQ